MSRRYLEELAKREELVQQREEAVQEREEVATTWETALIEWEKALQEKDRARKKREGVLKKKEEELSKREKALKKQTKRIRATVRRRAAGSSSPPRHPPPLSPATHVHQLPDEVLAQIFALLSLNTIVNVLSVCQRWRGVVEDRYLNKKLKFDHDTFTTKEALYLINSGRNLKSLQMSRYSDTVALLDAASNQCTNLLHLSVLCHNASSSALTGALRKVFRTSPRITSLDLSYVNTSKKLRFYQELGSLLPDLCKLQFDFGRLSDLQKDALLEGCSRNQIEEFKAPWACFKARIAKLVQFWASSLRVLELNASNLTEGDLALLAGCSELRCLKLHWLSTPSDWLCGLATLSHLEELHLEHRSEFIRENLCRFFSQSQSSHVLRKLFLLGLSWLDDRVLSSVAAFCPQLEELIAAGTNVTISGVREVLRCCRKLHNLYLDGTDASVAHIVPELPQLAPQLRRIRIGYAARRYLDEDTLRRVRAQMPHLRID